MATLFVGAICALFSGLAGIVAVLKGMPGDEQLHPRRYTRLVWVQIGIIVLLTAGSVLMFYLQNRSGIEAAARFVQLKEDQRDMFAMLYKQEFVRSVTLNVSPMGCVSPSDLKSGSAPTPMWADRLPRLFKEITGRLPAQNETAIIQLHVKYGGLWIILTGQADSSREQWFYAVGSEEMLPSDPVTVAPVPSHLSRSRVNFDLVDLRLSDWHLRQFMANAPSIQSIIQYRPVMGKEFDPRSELGFFRVALVGLYKGRHDLRQIPPANFYERPEWSPLKVPAGYLRCWNVLLTINGRLIANAMTSPLGERISHWPGPMIEAKLQEGLVWLAPSPDAWKELRPLMNCRVAWLLYSDSKTPCR